MATSSSRQYGGGPPFKLTSQITSTQTNDYIFIYYIRLYSYREKPVRYSCLVLQQHACTTHMQLVPIRSHIIASATGSVPATKVKQSLHRGMGMKGSFPNLGESKCWNKRMVDIKSMSCLGYTNSFEKVWGGSTTAGELSCSVAWRALLDSMDFFPTSTQRPPDSWTHQDVTWPATSVARCTWMTQSCGFLVPTTRENPLWIHLDMLCGCELLYLSLGIHIAFQ